MPDIRPLTEDDDARYRKLWRFGLSERAECFRIALEDDVTQDIPTDGAKDNFTLGAFETDELIGVVSLKRDTLTKMRHKGLVFRMFVHPERAGAGTGRALLETLIASVEAQTDLRQIYLTVLASNERAIRLYASLGFHPYAREPQAVRIGDDWVDEVQMVRMIDRDGRAPSSHSFHVSTP